MGEEISKRNSLLKLSSVLEPLKAIENSWLFFFLIGDTMQLNNRLQFQIDMDSKAIIAIHKQQDIKQLDFSGL